MWEKFLKEYGSIGGFLKKVVESEKAKRDFRNIIEDTKENITKENEDFLLQVLKSDRYPYICDAADALAYYKGFHVGREVFEIAKNLKEDSDFRACAIEALIKRAVILEPSIYSNIYGILEKEILSSNFNLEVLKVFTKILIREKTPYPEIGKELQEDFCNDCINLLIDNFQKFDQTIQKDIIKISSLYNSIKSIPLLFECKQKEFFKKTAEKAILRIGYKSVIELVKKSKDNNFILFVIEDFIEWRRDLKNTIRQKTWDIKDEDAVDVLVYLIKRKDISIKRNSIDALGYFGKFAIGAIQDLRKILKSSQNEELKIIAGGSVSKILTAYGYQTMDYSYNEILEFLEKIDSKLETHSEESRVSHTTTLAQVSNIREQLNRISKKIDNFSRKGGWLTFFILQVSSIIIDYIIEKTAIGLPWFSNVNRGIFWGSFIILIILVIMTIISYVNLRKENRS